jgi:8-oxo-dGTP pyrophosphatase MutT (NUDIX family)
MRTKPTGSPLYPYGQDLRERLSANLAAFERRPIDAQGLRLAAVALVVVGSLDDDGASVLLTRRPRSLRRHGGQLALPGGRIDEAETSEQAALRELREELGLALGPETILGTLDDFATRSGFRMTPIVAWGGKAPQLQPDHNEVERVFRIPFTDLDSPSIPHLRAGTEAGRPVMSAPIASLNDHVHAPTAALLYQFREVAMHGRATRVAHFDQPAFAWK